MIIWDIPGKQPSDEGNGTTAPGRVWLLENTSRMNDD